MIKVAFEFKDNKLSNFYVCSSPIDTNLTVLPQRPKRDREREYYYPLFTHLFEISREQLDIIWSNQSDYLLENDVLIGPNLFLEPLTIFNCDWKNGFCINDNGFITSRYIVFNDEKPPSYVVMTEPHNTLKKPKWTGSEWMEGYVEEVVEPSEIDVLKKQIKVLQQEMENLKA